MKGLALAAIALLAMSCSSSSGPVAGSTAPGARTTPVASPQLQPTIASSARTLCPSIQPAPTFSASTPSSRNLALVWLEGNTSQVVVRDLTDIAHAATVGILGNADKPQFVSGSEVSYGAPTGLVRAPLAGSPTTTVATCGGTPFAWSPDGTAAAYMAITADPKTQQLHLVRDGRDSAAGTAPALSFGVGCESRGCGDSWDIRLMYSPNGAYISLVEQLPVPAFRIWTSDGRLVKSLDAGQFTMSAWSGDTLYWRDEKGVETWRAGSESLLLPGVSWVRPHASPAGGQIVYETRDPGFSTAHVFLLDTASGKARELKSSRGEPAFLNAHLIWYQGEAPCPPGNCIAPTTATGKNYIYDLSDGTETQSVIAAVFDVWPHPA